MAYMGTSVSDAVSVKEIYTVLRPDITVPCKDIGDRHPFPEIFYLSRGRHKLLIDNARYELIGGQMILYAPDAYHVAEETAEFGTEACVLAFDAKSDILPPLYNRIITLTERQKAMLLTVINDGIQCFRPRMPEDSFQGMMLSENVEEHTLWRLKKQIELFLIDVYRTNLKEADVPIKKETNRDKEMARAVQFLHEHLTEVLTLEQIARECSMSTSKLKQLFRDKAGCGPISYLIDLRIKKAKQLIHEGEMNVSEIAESLGFVSPHYFSRQFKKATGMSPSEYAHKD